MCAKGVLKLQPDNEPANLFLGNVKIKNRWYDASEADLARTSERATEENSKYDKLSPREKQIYALKQDSKASFEKTPFVLDGAPSLPWVVFVDPSVPEPKLVAEAAMGSARVALEAFSGRFKTVYNVRGITEHRILPVCIYGSLSTLRSTFSTPESTRGFFDPATGRLYLAADDDELAETLLRPAIFQLLQFISAERPDAGGQAPTFWLHSGIASWLAAASTDPAGKRVPGTASPAMLTALRRVSGNHQLLSPAEIAGVTSGAYLGKGRGNARLDLDAQAWALTKFLNDGAGGKRREAFDRYMRWDLAGEGRAKAFEEEFGDLKQLAEEYRAFAAELLKD